MKVKDFVPQAAKRLVTATPELEIHAVAELLAESGTDLVVVVDEAGKMVGVVTDTDIVSWVAGKKEGEPWNATAGSLMSTTIFSCTPDQVFGSVVNDAVSRRYKHFPIVDGEMKPVGVVYVSDALIALHKDDQLSTDAMMAYIHQRGRMM